MTTQTPESHAVAGRTASEFSAPSSHCLLLVNPENTQGRISDCRGILSALENYSHAAVCCHLPCKTASMCKLRNILRIVLPPSPCPRGRNSTFCNRKEALYITNSLTLSLTTMSQMRLSLPLTPKSDTSRKCFQNAANGNSRHFLPMRDLRCIKYTAKDVKSGGRQASINYFQQLGMEAKHLGCIQGVLATCASLSAHNR